MRPPPSPPPPESRRDAIGRGGVPLFVWVFLFVGFFFWGGAAGVGTWKANFHGVFAVLSYNRLVLNAFPGGKGWGGRAVSWKSSYNRCSVHKEREETRTSIRRALQHGGKKKEGLRRR